MYCYFLSYIVQNLVFIIGGLNAKNQPNLNTQHLLKGSWRSTYQLKSPTSNHCMLRVNATFVMILGGKINGMPTKKTFYLNQALQGQWKDGPDMTTERYDFQCLHVSMGGVSLLFDIISTPIQKLFFI